MVLADEAACVHFQELPETKYHKLGDFISREAHRLSAGGSTSELKVGRVSHSHGLRGEGLVQASLRGLSMAAFSLFSHRLPSAQISVAKFPLLTRTQVILS